MVKNKIKKLFISMAILSLTLALFNMTINSDRQPFFAQENSNKIVDCDIYFDSHNGYTPIYEIVDDLWNGDEREYKTWGTVTSVFTNLGGNYYYFYMQSTDQFGRTAAIMVFQVSIYATTVSVGNVVTVIGYSEIYQGMPEISKPWVVNIDYETNSSPVEPLVADLSLYDGTPTSLSLAKSMGPRLVKIEDSLLTYWGTSYSDLTLSNGRYVDIFYGDGSNWSSISNAAYQNDSAYVTVLGFLNTYNGIVDLFIRQANQIIGNDIPPIEYSLTISANNFSMGTNYATGNYGLSKINGISYEYYRSVNKYDYYFNDDAISLLPYFSYLGEGTIGGSIYNISPIKGITSIEIDYYTKKTLGKKPLLYTSYNQIFDDYIELDFISYPTNKQYSFEDINFFKIESDNSELLINEITIKYTNESNYSSTTFLGSGQDDYRINPMVNNDPLYEGKQVSVPINVVRTGHSYTVTNYKTYTYYSFDYVYDNQSSLGDVSQFAYTDPVDVAAFYVAFKTYPANYVYKGDWGNAKDVFGMDARQVSYYQRTDGYATSVPWKSGYDYVPRYYELDIALDDNYVLNNYRGVARVVAWHYGFDPYKGATGYNSAPVCVYTDDHYATFSEYLNTGQYGTRFNSERYRTNYVYSAPITLNNIS